MGEELTIEQAVTEVQRFSRFVQAFDKIKDVIEVIGKHEQLANEALLRLNKYKELLAKCSEDLENVQTKVSSTKSELASVSAELDMAKAQKDEKLQKMAQEAADAQAASKKAVRDAHNFSDARIAELKQATINAEQAHERRMADMAVEERDVRTRINEMSMKL